MRAAYGLASASETPAVEGERRAPAVRRQLDLVAFGERRDPSGLGRSTADADVWLDDVDESPVDRSAKSNRVNSLSPAAIGCRWRRGRGPHPRRVVGSDRLLEPSDPARLDHAGRRDRGPAARNVPVRVPTIRSIAGPSPARAAWTRVMLAATSPFITPTRIFTASKPCAAYARSWAPISSAPAQPPDRVRWERVVGRAPSPRARAPARRPTVQRRPTRPCRWR